MSSAMLHALETLPSAVLAAEDAAPFAHEAAHEAARYAVLRRMGSAIRHQIAGALQPVSMIASLVERRVQAPAPNIEALRRNCGEMSALARSASGECVALMAWLAPHEGEQVPLNKGVQDCLHLLTTELSFRGFTVVDATQEVDASVSRIALRTLLPACLMALTDASAVQAQVHIGASVEHGMASLTLSLVPSADADATAQRAKAYRGLTWSDVKALARAEGVHAQTGPQSVQLQFEVQRQPPGNGAEVRWG